jgi:outer membrane receptor protein involved in Fe transport
MLLEFPMSIFLIAMPRASRLAVAVAATIVPFCPAFADPSLQATTLDAIEVRGMAQPFAVDSIAQARERLDERAGGTSLVDGDAYRDGRVSTLTDALGYAPGVFVQSRFGAEEARVSIRGSGLQRTYHGRGLEVLQDGSPLNLADGAFDMQAIEPLARRVTSKSIAAPMRWNTAQPTWAARSTSSRPPDTTPRVWADASKPAASVTCAGRQRWQDSRDAPTAS